MSLEAPPARQVSADESGPVRHGAERPEEAELNLGGIHIYIYIEYVYIYMY